MDTSVFATSNYTRKLSGPLQSRFFVAELEPYSYDQFYEITLSLLHNQSKVAPTIADTIWNSSRNTRDCVKIGKLAQSEKDVNFLVSILHSSGVSEGRGDDGA